MADLAKTDITGMESAGRVVPLYKGDYSSTASYQILDVVLYNNSSYIAKQTTTGNTPPTTQNFNDYWQLIAKGIIDADISDATVEFMQAETRTNIESGEDGKTLFGKIKKWFADLKSVAFSGSYNDLSDRPAIPSAVAVKGNAESSYRTGNVNLTPENIGAIATSKVLTTAEQINANTDTSNVAGATAVKAMVSQINSNMLGKQKIIKKIAVSLEFTNNIYNVVSYCDYNFGKNVDVIGINGVSGSWIWLPLGATSIYGRSTWRFTTKLLTSEPYEHNFEILYVEL